MGKQTKVTDMTSGSIWRHMIVFALPVCLGMAVQSLYSVVDAIVVGQAINEFALAATGSTDVITRFMMFLFTGVSGGAGIVVAQYFGAHDTEKLRKAIGSSMIISIISGVIISILGFAFAKPMLLLVNTPDDGTLELAKSYLSVIFLGMIFNITYNFCAGILRSLGDSRNPFIFLLIANGINIVLDILFVAVLHWGVQGAAWATIISQMVSATLAVIKLTRLPEEYALRLGTMKLDKAVTVSMLKIGLPMGLQQGLVSGANMFLQGYINGLGSMVMAGYTSASKIDHFVVMPILSLGQASMTMIGQNLGAGKMERVTQSVRISTAISIIFGLVAAPIVYFILPYTLRLFTDSEAVIEQGTIFLHIMPCMYWAMGWRQVLDNCFRAAGKTNISFIINVVSCILMRLVLGGMILSPIMGFSGICWGIVGDFFLPLGVCLLYYRFGKWRENFVARAPAKSGS